MMSPNAVDDFTGIAGFAARGIDAMGEWGVGPFTFAETIIPPIPSEVILPLAGFLTKQGTMSLGLVFVASTLGAYAGALLLYWLGQGVPAAAGAGRPERALGCGAADNQRTLQRHLRLLQGAALHEEAQLLAGLQPQGSGREVHAGQAGIAGR